MATLWEPPTYDVLASGPENDRVRALYWQEKTRVLGWEHPMGHGGRGTCKACGDFRGNLARDWVALAERARDMTDVDLVIPGAQWRRPLREGETVLERRVDAARTRIRQFEAGTDQRGWVLVGIETTIADRNGRSYPTGAYRSQRQLDLDLGGTA